MDETPAGRRLRLPEHWFAGTAAVLLAFSMITGGLTCLSVKYARDAGDPTWSRLQPGVLPLCLILTAALTALVLLRACGVIEFVYFYEGTVPRADYGGIYHNMGAAYSLVLISGMLIGSLGLGISAIPDWLAILLLAGSLGYLAYLSRRAWNAVRLLNGWDKSPTR